MRKALQVQSVRVMNGRRLEQNGQIARTHAPVSHHGAVKWDVACVTRLFRSLFIGQLAAAKSDSPKKNDQMNVVAVPGKKKVGNAIRNP